MTCEGMFADISWKAAETKNATDKKKYEELSSEYVNFKREYVKHFQFSSAASRSMYGKKP